MRSVRQYGHLVCSEQDPMTNLKGLKMGTFSFWKTETGAKSVEMATIQWMSFCFFCNIHFWRHVWRTPHQYFQRYSWFSVVLFKWNCLWHHDFPHLHSTKISVEQKKIFQKEKRHSSLFWKAFQISTNYFSIHMHFKH